MTGNDDLFQLIQSMSKSEKRYFKLDAQKSTSKGGKNKYVQLFDAINSMEEYDEAKLKKKAFVKHLSVEKGELYRKILRSMRSFRSDKSVYAQIKEMILDANYLIELGLVAQAEKMLKKAKNLAYQVEHHLAILEINQEERYIARITRSKDYETEISALIDENTKILSFINEEMEILSTHDQIFNLVLQKYHLKGEKSKAILDEKFSNLSGEDKLIQSPRAQLRFFKSKGHYHSLLRNFEKLSLYCQKIIDWWEKYPKVKNEEFGRFLGDFSNLITAYFMEERYEELPELLDQLTISDQHNFHVKSTLFYFSSLHNLLYCMNTCRFEEAKALVPDIEKGFKIYLINEAEKLNLSANISSLFFVSEAYQDGIPWLERVLKNRKTRNRQDIQQSFRLLKIISLFELGEIDQLENELRATSRYFQKHTDLQQENYESIAFNTLKKICASDLQQQKKLLQELNQSLQQLSEKPNEKRSVGFEELLLWVQSRLSKQSIIQFMETRGNCKD
ncbi:MAG: hypothetical protein AAF985_13385 [Bacteroidota bacterium]